MTNKLKLKFKGGTTLPIAQKFQACNCTSPTCSGDESWEMVDHKINVGDVIAVDMGFDRHGNMVGRIDKGYRLYLKSKRYNGYDYRDCYEVIQ